MDSLIITIYGLGKTGAATAGLLLQLQQETIINVMDPSPSIHGTFLDLAHSLPLFAGSRMFLNREDLIPESHFIIYTAGASNPHGISRMKVADENKKLAERIFDQQKLRQDVIIIIISNPVDVISHHIRKITGLSAKQVLGTGTFLDTNRFRYVLAEWMDVAPSRVDAMVIGEHGDSMVMLFDEILVDGRPVNIGEPDRSRLGLATRTAAWSIRETQSGTWWGVARCAEHMLRALSGHSELTVPVSFLADEHPLFRDLGHVTLGLPVTLSKGSVNFPESFRMSEREKQSLRDSAEEVKKYL